MCSHSTAIHVEVRKERERRGQRASQEHKPLWCHVVIAAAPDFLVSSDVEKGQAAMSSPGSFTPMVLGDATSQGGKYQCLKNNV